MVGPVLPQAGRRKQQLRGHSHELPGEPRDSKDAAQGYSEEAVQGCPANRIEVSSIDSFETYLSPLSTVSVLYPFCG